MAISTGSQGLWAGTKAVGGKALGYALPGYFLYDGYQRARDEGSGVISSAIQGVGEFALWDLMYGGLGLVGGLVAPLAVEGLKALPGAAVSAYDSLNTQARQMERLAREQQPFRNYTFVDGPQLYTMRQAGLALAQQSKYKLQETMIGNEARFMHR